MSGQEWTFRSEIVGPDGVTVSVAVNVPVRHAGEHVVDITEFTQIAAARLLKQLEGTSNDARLFQVEVPF